ncbi:unnamed protein product [Porites lobata]|uniref:G-protein coupled receptors family 1 profile domain-containing protein n=1 Tax=Porites lobata TaxID=104759 RepID=A0ABN8RME4_9CNID|nr:unnamed protein product [Porites lobata]
MKNLSGGVNQQTVGKLYCSAEFIGKVHGEFIFLSVINLFLSITAFLGNTLILVALHKDTSIHPPSKLLYRNLAKTDLCVGVIGERYFLGVTLCSVSLITLTAISVERLLALLLGLRYREVVTLKRTRLIATGGWIVSIVGASISFLNLFIVSLYQYIATAFCLVTQSVPTQKFLCLCVITKFMVRTMLFKDNRAKQIH